MLVRMKDEVGGHHQPLGGGLLSSLSTARTGGTIVDMILGCGCSMARVLIGICALEGGGEAQGGAQRALVGRDGGRSGGGVASSAWPGCGVREAVCGGLAAGCDGPDAPGNRARRIAAFCTIRDFGVVPSYIGHVRMSSRPGLKPRGCSRSTGLNGGLCSRPYDGENPARKPRTFHNITADA